MRMDLQTFLADAGSRRTFFRGAGVTFAGGSAVFLAACGKQDTVKSTTTQSSSSNSADVAILNTAIDLENMAIAAYTGGAKLLKGKVLALGKQFLAQEQEHADALSQAVKAMGGTPNRAKPTYDFPTLASQADVLIFASTIENTAIGAYIDSIPKLSSPDLRATAAAIVTNEAEHLAVLQGALGRPEAPNAFVKGAA